MQETFDLYAEWLGFPAGRPPANHYELLGVPLFEADPEVISHAADCLRGQIRKVRPGQRLAEWQGLLDQLNAAKACLMEPGAKAQYDASLRAPSPPAQTATPPGPTMATPPLPGGPPMAVPPPLSPPTVAPPAAAPTMAGPAPIPPPPEAPSAPVPPPSIPPGAVPVGYPSGAAQGGWQPPPYPGQAPGYAPPTPPLPPLPTAYVSQPTGYSAPPTGLPPLPTTYPPQPAAYPTPPSGYPPPSADIPPQPAGYPPPTAGYPPPTGFPPYQPGYAPQPAAYPPQPTPQPTDYVPPQPTAYAPQAPGYPAQTPGYPAQAPGFPGQTPGFPAQAPGYPAQAQGYPPQPTGYSPSPAPVPGAEGAPYPYGPTPAWDASAAPAAAGVPVAQSPAQPAMEQVLPPDAAPASVVPARPAAPRKRSPTSMVAVCVLLLVAAGLAFALYGMLNRPPAEVATGTGPSGAHGQADPKGAKPGTGTEKPNPKDKPGPAEKPNPAEKPGEKDKPQPKDKPEPPDKPEPKDKPDPTENPKPKEEPKIDPAKRTAWQKAVGDARVSLAEHDVASAAQHLTAAAANAQTPEEHAVVDRLTALRGHLEQFWSGIRQSMSTLSGGEELVVGDTRVAVVEADQEKLILKAAGRIRRYAIEEMPSWVVLPLAERWFAKQPSSKVFLGAYLAVDPKGSAERARQLWQEAAKAGLDVAGLMEELDQFPHGGSSPGGTTSKPSAPRSPVPSDPEKLKAAEQLVRQKFAKEYQKTESAVDKLDLAGKLLGAAASTNDNPDARFVMLREARRLAASAGKAAMACEAIDHLAEHFEVDPLAMKVEAVTEAAEAGRTLTSHKETAQAAMEIARQAATANQKPTAKRMADLAVEAAKKSQGATLLREATALRQQIDAGGT